MENDIQKKTKVQGKEKFSYWVYFFGQNMFYGLVAINMQTFFSDVGITAAAIAVIMFFTKVWDAVNDPLLGIIVDKVQFKSGRFLPWLRISLPLLAVSSVFLFILPVSGSPALKIAWATIAYVAWSMSYTLCDVPVFVLPTSMTNDVEERGQLLTTGRFFAMVGITGTSMVLPMLQNRLGWFATGLLLTVISSVVMLPLLVIGKERYVAKREESISLKQMFTYVSKNKYLLLFYVALLFSGLLNFQQYVQIYFARICLGNQDYASMISMLSLIPLVVSGVMVPVILKKIDKYVLFIITNGTAAVLGIIMYFVGYSNLTLFYIMLLIKGFFTGANNILLFTFTPDCIEYGTYHTGERAEGVAASVQTFFSKLVGSLSGPIAMLILSAFGFVEGENAMQPASVTGGLWLLYAVVPSVGMLLAVAVLRFYKLRTADVQFMAKYNNKEISKEEAESHLKEKYGPAADLTY